MLFWSRKREQAPAAYVSEQPLAPTVVIGALDNEDGFADVFVRPKTYAEVLGPAQGRSRTTSVPYVPFEDAEVMWTGDDAKPTPRNPALECLDDAIDDAIADVDTPLPAREAPCRTKKAKKVRRRKTNHKGLASSRTLVY